MTKFSLAAISAAALATFAQLAIAQSAHAEEWSADPKMMETGEAVDLSTLSKDGGRISFWTISLADAGTKHQGRPVDHFMERVELDCSANTIGVVTLDVYGADGKFMGRTAKPGAAVPIAPESIGASMRDDLCSAPPKNMSRIPGDSLAAMTGLKQARENSKASQMARGGGASR